MFKKGQKVVCVDSTKCDLRYCGILTEGEIYTITNAGITPKGTNWVEVKEVELKLPYTGFKAKRFRSIDSDWVNDLFHKIQEEIEDEFLVEV